MADKGSFLRSLGSDMQDYAWVVRKKGADYAYAHCDTYCVPAEHIREIASRKEGSFEWLAAIEDAWDFYQGLHLDEGD